MRGAYNAGIKKKRIMKKVYLKPAINVDDIQQLEMLCASDIKTNGLDDDDLNYDESGGDQGSAWSRKNDRLWDDCDAIE